MTVELTDLGVGIHLHVVVIGKYTQPVIPMKVKKDGIYCDMYTNTY